MDFVKRSLTTLISAIVIAYVVYLIVNGAQVVSSEFAGMNIIGLIGIAAIASYIAIIYGVYPIYHPWQKRIFLILGVGLIFFGEIVFINDAQNLVYANDIVKLFGVLIIWFGATGLLSKTKALEEGKKRRTHKNAEIIEV